MHHQWQQEPDLEVFSAIVLCIIMVPWCAWEARVINSCSMHPTNDNKNTRFGSVFCLFVMYSIMVLALIDARDNVWEFFNAIIQIWRLIFSSLLWWRVHITKKRQKLKPPVSVYDRQMIRTYGRGYRYQSTVHAPPCATSRHRSRRSLQGHVS